MSVPQRPNLELRVQAWAQSIKNDKERQQQVIIN